jgi:FKBP-type peptidyl-prolyl cis-trans isomerase 2
MEVKIGNKVKVEYEGRLENGEIFDSTKNHGGEALEFVVGAKMLVSGFENAVIGMKEGEEKEVNLKPEEAYGEHNPDYVQKVPKDKFPEEAQVGMMIGIPTPMGQIPAKIVDMDDKMVTLDLNSPLAGKNLIFKIKIISIEDGDFLKENHEHSCNCKDEDCSCE